MNKYCLQAFSLSVLLTLTACNQTGNTPSGDAIPLWARGTVRTVENGYIIFAESDDEPSQSLAQFRAESSALNDLANECSLIPKGARVEDRFDHKVAHLYQAYAKIAVEAALCDKAKKANTPDAIRAISNPVMTEQVKKYQADIGETAAILADAEENGSDDDQAKPKAEADSDDGPTKVAPAKGSRFAVRDDEHFYVIREQLFTEKTEAVAFQPASPELQKFTQNSQGQEQGLANYEEAHPAIRTASHAWSYYRHQVMRPRISTTGKEVRPIGVKPTQPQGSKPIVKPRKRDKSNDAPMDNRYQ